MSQQQTSRRFIAYVAPCALYIVPTMFETRGWLGLSYEIVCTLKGVMAAAALWAYRQHYPRFSTVGFGLAVITGAMGCMLWIVLDRFQNAIPSVQQLMTVLHGSRVGYDPFSGEGSVAAGLAFVAVRLVELALIVPVIEEVFWRGFLSRYLIADDFENVPQGAFTWYSFILVTLTFGSVHPEILAAITWGVLINALYCKTANLWACIVMHAVTNGLLAAYILATRNWHLW